MSTRQHDFRARIRLSPGLAVGLGVAVVLHAAIIIAAQLAPKQPNEKGRFSSDCFEPASAPAGEPAAGPSISGGQGAGAGGAVGSRVYSPGPSFALGEEALVPHDAMIIWPCCGPGCPTALEGVWI